MSGAIGDDIPRPYNADWAWRPQLWRGLPDFPELSSVPNRTRLGDEITIFHDCRVSELTLHRMPGRNGRSTCALGLDVARFDGTFLSLALDLPHEAIQGLKRTHLLRLNAIIEAESPMKIFARINVKHGPNTERIVRELPVPDRDLTVEFDLAYTDLNEKRIEKAWLDLIFDAPERNRIILHDLTLARRPRAAF